MIASRLIDTWLRKRGPSRTGRLLLVVLPLGAAALLPSSVGCSNGDEDDPSSVPSDSDDPARDAGPDASQTNDAHVGVDADAGCEAGTAGCEAPALTCEVADWCPSPTTMDARYALTAVWGSGKNDVWAVGSAGTVLHWDGGTWTSTPVNTKHTLFGIWGSSANDVWIVSTPTLLVHGTGFKNGTATWEEHVPVETAAWQTVKGKLMHAVWGTSASDVWIGGESISYYEEDLAVVNQWRRSGDDGKSSWKRTFRTSMTIRGIWGSSANDVWIVGRDTALPEENGKTFHSNGTLGEEGVLAWTEVDAQSNAELEAVWGSSGADVWTVGARGTIRHFTAGASAWNVVASPTSRHLHAVWGSSKNDVWAVGDAGMILHYDGKAWTESTVAFASGERPNLYGVWGSGPDDVWAVGEGIVLHHSNSGAKPSRGGSK